MKRLLFKLDGLRHRAIMAMWRRWVTMGDRRALKRGWSVDGDGWLYRPVRDDDELVVATLGVSCNAFAGDHTDVAADAPAAGAYLFCRNGWQALRLDAGVLV